MSSENIIELKDVWKKYNLKGKFHNSLREDIIKIFLNREETLEKNEFWALKEISFSINRGESLGLYGPNGSGKTTILKLIASVTYPTKGSVKVVGKVAPLISVGAGFHHDLTGRENIIMNGTILGMGVKEIKSKMDEIIEFSEIPPEFLQMPVKKYSSGMHVRLGFSIAVHSTADIILMDEVLAVGDQAFKEKSFNKVKELISSDKTFVIVTHNKKMLEEITDRIIYIDHGEIVN